LYLWSKELSRAQAVSNPIYALNGRNLPQLLRDAERRVNAHVFKRGGDDSLASIPANLDRDVDLLLMEAALEIELLQDREARLREKLGARENATCNVCGDPLPPLSEWSTPACPLCTAIADAGKCAWCKQPLPANTADNRFPQTQLTGAQR
jgi:hypothetical protein